MPIFGRKRKQESEYDLGYNRGFADGSDAGGADGKTKAMPEILNNRRASSTPPTAAAGPAWSSAPAGAR